MPSRICPNSQMEHTSLLGNLNIKSLETTLISNFLLQSYHSLLITSRISRINIKFPLKELVGIVRTKVLTQNTKTFTILGNLLPITSNILQVLGEIGARSFEDLAIYRSCHLWFDVDICLVSFYGRSKNMIGCS